MSCRVAREIVVRDRLFEPVETLIVEGVAAVQRVAEAEALVEVDHQLDVLANGVAYRLDGGDVVGEALPSETQLQTLKLAFGNKCCRLLAEFVDRREPKAVAVIGRNWRERAAEKDGER